MQPGEVRVETRLLAGWPILVVVGCVQRPADRVQALNSPLRRSGTKWTGQLHSDHEPRASQEPRADREPRGRRWWSILTPLALLAIGASLLWPGRHQWALSLFRQPARYTVLSFSHASALPPKAHINEPIRVSFVVGNQEGHAVEYRYVLSTSGDGRFRILREAKRAVAADATWVVSAVVWPRCGSSRCRIEVSLPGHPEKIDFLITITAPGA